MDLSTEYAVRNHGLLITLILTGVVPVAAQQPVPPATAGAIADATRLMDRVAEEVWPGWGSAPTQLLLIADSTEYFLRTPRTGEVVWQRHRIFPARMQATFPAVDGIPTIVIGTPAGTGTPADQWPLVVTHEHFHQLQYTRADYNDRLKALDLARGDTTGMWALNYPFPYDSVPIQRAVKRWADALHAALLPTMRPTDPLVHEAARTKAFLDTLLAPDDRRYLDFQLWQEGVPRWIELAAAREGHRARLVSDSTLAWEERRLLDDLTKIDLGRDHRVVVYALGAAIAELCERSGRDWRKEYFERMFEPVGLTWRSGVPVR